jgi:riboflavin kinase / FMN adenylyltransferase
MSKKNSIVTIGVFDGVHLGHRVVIKKVVARAKKLGTSSVVVTFEPDRKSVV